MLWSIIHYKRLQELNSWAIHLKYQLMALIQQEKKTLNQPINQTVVLL